jgi:hypothetical protein
LSPFILLPKVEAPKMSWLAIGDGGDWTESSENDGTGVTSYEKDAFDDGSVMKKYNYWKDNTSGPFKSLEN